MHDRIVNGGGYNPPKREDCPNTAHLHLETSNDTVDNYPINDQNQISLEIKGKIKKMTQKINFNNTRKLLHNKKDYPSEY